jgi:hypothetical protein
VASDPPAALGEQPEESGVSEIGPGPRHLGEPLGDRDF